MGLMIELVIITIIHKLFAWFWKAVSLFFLMKLYIGVHMVKGLYPDISLQLDELWQEAIEYRRRMK
jgi:hypothetical protein